MKFFFFAALSLVSSVAAFIAPVKLNLFSEMALSKISLNAKMERRTFIFASGLGFVSTATPAFAAGQYGKEQEYKPKADDYKQIYFLGTTLDILAVKVSDPDQSENARKGLVEFNKDPNFYSEYARRFITKSVKNGASDDIRVGYIREASGKISSIQELLEGRQGLEDKAAAIEAVKRIRDSQRLIAKFFAESGIEGEEKVIAYIRAHP